MDISHVILYAIVPIIVVMLAGYISGKKGVFTGEDSKKFNKVVLDYALPAALFVSIVQASREMLVKDIKLTIISTVGIMVCFMLVYFIFKYCFKKNTGADAAVSALISGSPTIGFLGFAVLEPIFGTSRRPVADERLPREAEPRLHQKGKRLETRHPCPGAACRLGSYPGSHLGCRRDTLA